MKMRRWVQKVKKMYWLRWGKENMTSEQRKEYKFGK
jgi:hypothetical protein